MKEINQIKDEIQREAHTIWMGSGRTGTIAAGTGFGKSRIAVLEVRRMATLNFLSPGDVLLVTPTEKMRDETWPSEFNNWDAGDVFADFVKIICFASLKKEVGNHYKLVILDEVHRLTEMSAAAFKEDGKESLQQFFSQNLADATLGLTATVPDPKRDPEKAVIIQNVAPVVFTYNLDQGVEDGMIRDYEIRVILSELDAKNKVMPGGTKVKPFMTTEKSKYEFLEKKIRRFRALAAESFVPSKAASMEKMVMLSTMERNRFIANLPSKKAVAKKCLELMAKDKRTLVFCGGIEQCEELLAPNTFHSKTGSDAFNAFNRKESNILGVVNAANEGINFVDLDQSLIIQVDSNERNLVQRIGRNLRMGLEGKAIIYILCVKDTADERWLKKSLASFDAEKITYYDSRNFM